MRENRTSGSVRGALGNRRSYREMPFKMNMRDDKIVNQFVESAKNYCSILETDPEDPEIWLEDILKSLSCLYAFAHILPEYDFQEELYEEDAFDVTNDEIRELMSKLMNILKDQNWYWAYFDPSEPNDSRDKPVRGNIYRDIKPGLKAWDTNDDSLLPEIIFDWKFPLFGSHWGVHAVSAMRALHPICYLRGLHNNNKNKA